MFRRRLIVLAVLAILLVAGYMFWLRDSSLVAVKRLTVTGVSGSEAVRIRAALARGAGDMTTLHVRYGELDQAVKPFPVVESISAKPSFPNGLVVHVTLRKPALVLDAAGRRVTAAADGTLLRGMGADAGMPVVHAPEIPKGTRLNGDLLLQALVLGGLPRQLRPYFESSSVLEGGVRISLKNGPELRFGDGSDVRAKWAAAIRVLSDPGVKGAGYVDVSAPRRPAVGGIVQSSSASAPASIPPGA